MREILKMFQYPAMIKIAAFCTAGAVGCAVGNLVGDFGGTLTWLSTGGMLANFLSAFMPYKIWNAFNGLYGEEGKAPSLSSRGLTFRLLLSGLASVTSCSAVLGITFDLSRSYPAINAFNMVFCNNAASTVIGFIMFAAICKMKRQIPYWATIMQDETTLLTASQSKRRIALYAISTLACSLFVLIYDAALHEGLAPTGQMGAAAPLAVFFAYIVVSLFI